MQGATIKITKSHTTNNATEVHSFN